MNLSKPLAGMLSAAFFRMLPVFAGGLPYLGWIFLFFLTGNVAYGSTTPAFVQEKDNQVNSGKTSGVTFSSPVTAGNLIVVYLIWDNAGGAIVSDSLGNPYASVANVTLWKNGKYSAQVFYAINLRGGVNTVTATFVRSVNSFGIVYAHEYSGISQTSPIDVTTSAAGNSGALNSGTVKTTNATDLIFAGGVSANVVTAPGAGYTARSTAQGNVTEDKIVAAAGPYSATASHSGGAWAMQMVAFRSLAGGASVSPPSISVQPLNQTVTLGQTATFTIQAGGSAPLSYQWQKNGAPIVGANSASYTTPFSTSLDNNATFRVVINNSAGSVISNAATMTVNSPAVTLQSISVVPANPFINRAQTQQFTATGAYSDGSSKDLTPSVAWVSSSTAVATIDSKTGLATGLMAGTSQITATIGTVVSQNDILTITSSGGNSYATNFPLTENPIAEGGKWINGKASGLDWADVGTKSGLAFGTEKDTVNYDDSTAILTGTWGANQTAQATVHTLNQNSGMFEEVELRLRSSISAHSNTGYEFNYRCTADGSQYVQIVRWNGPLGNFTMLDGRAGPGLHDGDVVTATAVGNTLSTYVNGKLIFQVTDSTYTSGSPGVGFYIQGGSPSQQSDFGFTSFTASDGGTADTNAPSTPANVTANVISASEIDLSWSPSSDNLAVIGYHVIRNNSQIATVTGASFADTTVIPGVPYTYAVTAFDAAGNLSAQSVSVQAQTTATSDTTAPSIPTNLQGLNVTSTTLMVTWSASSDNVAVAGYRIFRDGTQVATTVLPGYADSSLSASTSYVYTVAAYDGSGNVSAPSQDLFVTTKAAAAITPTFVQVNNNQIASGTSTQVTFQNPTMPGNTIVVYVIWNNAGSVGLTDSLGNTFVNVGGAVSWGTGYSAQIFYAFNLVGGIDTVTAAFRTSVTSFGVVYAHEYAGISSINPVDVTTASSGSSATLNSGTAITTSANDLIFGAGVSDNVVTAPGTGFILRDQAYGNITEDRAATSIGSYAATATHNGSMWGMQMVAFRAAQ